MQVTLPPIHQFRLLNGQYPQQEKRVCIFAFYSPIPGCFQSLDKIAELSQNQSTYTLIISLDTEEKMLGFLAEDSPRGKILQSLNVAVDSQNTLLSFLDYNKADRLPAVFVFDDNRHLVWSGNPRDANLGLRGFLW